MGILVELLKNPDEFYPLLKLQIAAKLAERRIPSDPKWRCCYTMLHEFSSSFSLIIPQLGPELRNTMCIFYLVLRALDTVVQLDDSGECPEYILMGMHPTVGEEDDTSLDADVKAPTLEAFHCHIYDVKWHFSCGLQEYNLLMDEFHHVSTAFLELRKGYQEAIEDVTKRMGAGMAKFILMKEMKTIDEYNEYCHYVAGLLGVGLSKMFYYSGLEDLASDNLSNSMGLFLQKTNIIRDYLVDVYELPQSRMHWPRQIWSKYANKLEDLKYEENSEKAVQCLNDMVTDALLHVEDCLKYMSNLRDPAIFRFCAIPQIMAIGALALCYNNIEVFRGAVKIRRGLIAKVIDRTKTMSDVYGAFFDFLCILKSKVEKNDANATKTLRRVEAIQKACKDSGLRTERRSYITESRSRYTWTLVIVFILLAIIAAFISTK